jgi:hypothetical protein
MGADRQTFQRHKDYTRHRVPRSTRRYDHKPRQRSVCGVLLAVDRSNCQSGDTAFVCAQAKDRAHVDVANLFDALRACLLLALSVFPVSYHRSSLSWLGGVPHGSPVSGPHERRVHQPQVDVA